jgi:hypothetical protein
VDELISPSYPLNDPILSGSQIGPKLYKRRVVEFTTGFPDLRFTIEDMTTEKEKVVVSWIISGTLPATGSKIFVEGITIHHITNGKDLDSRARWDALGLLNNSETFLLLDRWPLRCLDEDPQIARDVAPSIFIMRAIYLSLLTSKIHAGLISYRPVFSPKFYAH